MTDIDQTLIIDYRKIVASLCRFRAKTFRHLYDLWGLRMLTHPDMIITTTKVSWITFWLIFKYLVAQSVVFMWVSNN